MLCEPLVGLVPLQPPEAVQEVALVELQVSVEAPPGATLVGFAVKVAVGMGRTVTVTLATGLVPPGPVQVSEYVVAVVSAAVFWVPLIASAPLQPPAAVHDVASVELHVSVDFEREATLVGLAVKVAVGTGAMLTVALATALVPPGPVQVKEYDLLAERAPVF